MGIFNIISAAILATGTGMGTFGIQGDAPNCGWHVPPANSGEAIGDEPELDLKIFPRLVEFPPHYTGCQISWRRLNGEWVRFSVVYLEKGKPVALWGRGVMPDGGDLWCRYRDAKVVMGPAEVCPEVSGIVLHSMPAGCAKRWRLEAGQPKGCAFD